MKKMNLFSQKISRNMPLVFLLAVVVISIFAVFYFRNANDHNVAFSDTLDTLWNDRTPYIGNNSAIAKLVADTGLAAIGKHEIALHTEQPPYGITITYDTTSKDADSIDFEMQATELLGLVSNTDYVEIKTGTRIYRLSTEEATKKLGYDVKQLGSSKESLRAYMQKSID